MSSAEVDIVGHAVVSRGRRFDFEYPVRAAFWLNASLVVLFDSDARLEKFGQFPNLIAVDESGKRLWVAELPTTKTGDHYYRIASTEPLVAYSFSSYDCEIDVDTGRIRTREFTK